MNLQQDLRQYVDDAAPPISLEEVIQTGPTIHTGHRWSRGGPRLVLGAAAAMALVAASWAGMSRDSGSGLSTASSSREQSFLGEWTENPGSSGRLDPSVAGRDVVVRDIERLGDWIYAVGQERDIRSSVGALWRSADGRRWERIRDDAFTTVEITDPNFVPAGIALETIAERDGRLVLAGSLVGDSVVPVLFVSDDGLDWRRIDVQTSGVATVSVVSVVATQESFVLVAIESTGRRLGLGSTVSVWRSDNGDVWTRQAADGLPLGAQPGSATVIGDRIVMVGQAEGRGDDAAVWTSDDGGTNWSRSTVRSADGGLGISEIVDVVVGGDTLVAVGARNSQVDIGWSRYEDGPIVLEGRRDLSLWRSDDAGSTWTETLIAATPDRIEIDSGISWGPDGYLITATAVSTGGAKNLAWTSTDGRTLSPLPVPPAMGSLAATVGVGDRYVVVADTEPLPLLEVDPPPASLRTWTLR